MEVEGEKPSSLPSNYVTIHQLKERWLQQQQQQKSPSKPEPENPNPRPKPKPNENAIKPTNTQNQRPNFGRVTKDHKLKEVKVDDNGSTSKTLVADDMKNPYKNDAAKHNQRPNYRPVNNQPKPKVVDDGSTSKTKTLVADDLKNPKIRPMGDDDGLSTKALVVDVIDNKLLIGENETGDSKFNLKKNRKKSKFRRRNSNVVTDQNPTGAEPELGAKVVEGEMEKKSYPANQNPVGAELKPETEVEVVVEEKREERRHRNGNLRFGAESERKTEPEPEPEPEQEAEVVEENMKKKNHGRGKPADRNRNEAELKSQMVEEVVMEKWKRGLGYGRRNGNSRAVWEQKETALVDGNNGGGSGGVVEEVVKERNVGQGRDKNEGYGRERNGGYGRERNGGYGRDRNGGYGRDKKRVPSGSFGEQQRLIWVKKGESVVPN